MKPTETEQETFKCYEPEIVSIRKDAICAAHDCLLVGLEYARESLARHDLELGRTTRKNRAAAELIESDVRGIEIAMKTLDDFRK